MSAGLPEGICVRAAQVDELLHDSPQSAEVAHLMTEMLHIAVYGSTWARPEATRLVWLQLLSWVTDRLPR
jgi:hypothetical protein